MTDRDGIAVGADELVALKCDRSGATATKTFIWENGHVRKINYNAKDRFKVHITTVCNIRQLSAALTKLEDYPTFFVVRNPLADASPTNT